MRRTATLAVVLFLSATTLSAQTIVGELPLRADFSTAGSPARTIIDLSHPATLAGSYTDAAVQWFNLAGPCTNAFTLRFFHPTSAASYSLVAERGPFSTGTEELVAVTLTPAVDLAKGDLIGIYLPGVCGGVDGGYASDKDIALSMNGNYVGGPLGSGSLQRGNTYAMRASQGADALVAVLPVVGFAVGNFGSLFRTDFQVTNVSNQTLHTKLVFHPAGQAAAPGDPNSSLTLSAGATISSDLLAAMGATGVGSLDIFAKGEPAPLVTAHIFNDSGAAGTNGFFEPAVRVREALTSPQTASFTFPTDMNNFRMNVGVRTLDSGATIVLAAYDAAGTETAPFHGVSYAPNTFSQVSLQQFLASFGQTATPAGSVLLQVTGGSVILYTSTTDNRTNDSALFLVKPAD
jgi:hypothetical protein